MQASTGAGGTRPGGSANLEALHCSRGDRAEPTSEGEGGIPARRARALPVSQPRGVRAEGPPLPSPSLPTRSPAGRPGQPPASSHLRAGDNLALEREGERRAGVGRHRSAGRGRVAAPAPPPGPPRGGGPRPRQQPLLRLHRRSAAGRNPGGRAPLGGEEERRSLLPGGSAGSRPALSKRWAKPFLLLTGRGPGQECQVRGDFSFVTKLKQPKLSPGMLALSH